MYTQRDDVHSVLNDGKDFKEFCPDWKYANLWQKWTDFGWSQMLYTRFALLMYIYNDLTVHGDPDGGT